MTILTDQDVYRLRVAVSNGTPHKAIARQYGIAPSTVSTIATGARRSSAPGPLTARETRTQCINGHPRTPENTRQLKTGYTACKECYRTTYKREGTSD